MDVAPRPRQGVVPAREIFRKAGADNVEWVWSPNIVSAPGTPENNMHLYYPGDEFVDRLGSDGYNFGDHHDKWHVWQTFEQIYVDVLKDFQERYADKPVLITEFGCAPGKPGQRRQWILDAHRTLERFEQVRAVIWFNYTSCARKSRTGGSTTRTARCRRSTRLSPARPPTRSRPPRAFRSPEHADRKDVAITRNYAR